MLMSAKIETFTAWSELVSLFLLVSGVLLGGIDPVRPLWGRSPLHTAILVANLTLQLSFTAVRLILEGIYETAGPREFLAASLIYSARWLWLWSNMARYNTRSGRLFRVARSLRYLKMLRLGPSTHSTRLGEKELVLRSGIHRINSAEKYWRGIPVVIIFQQSVETWEIHLLEPKLHAALLDIFGTIEYGSQDPHNLDDAYKRIYTAVMETGPVCEHLKVDYAPFFSQFRPVPVTSFSRRLEATEESELGQIARRVAADAVLYVKDPDARFRTQQHVTCINECLENALQSYMHPASDNNYVAINISSPSSILR